MYIYNSYMYRSRKHECQNTTGRKNKPFHFSVFRLLLHKSINTHIDSDSWGSSECYLQRNRNHAYSPTPSRIDISLLWVCLDRHFRLLFFLLDFTIHKREIIKSVPTDKTSTRTSEEGINACLVTGGTKGWMQRAGCQ